MKMNRSKRNTKRWLAIGFVLAVVTTSVSSSGVEGRGKSVHGFWYLTAASPPLTGDGAIPGLVTLLHDGTAFVSDGPELGNFPLTTLGTALHGRWMRTRKGAVRIVVFRLVHEETLDQLKGFLRIDFELRPGEGNDGRLAGTGTLAELSCDAAGPTPFAMFNCPDPTSSAFTVRPGILRVEMHRFPLS